MTDNYFMKRFLYELAKSKNLTELEAKRVRFLADKLYVDHKSMCENLTTCFKNVKLPFDKEYVPPKPVPKHLNFRIYKFLLKLSRNEKLSRNQRDKLELVYELLDWKSELETAAFICFSKGGKYSK